MTFNELESYEAFATFKLIALGHVAPDRYAWPDGYCWNEFSDICQFCDGDGTIGYGTMYDQTCGACKGTGVV